MSLFRAARRLWSVRVARWGARGGLERQILDRLLTETGRETRPDQEDRQQLYTIPQQAQQQLKVDRIVRLSQSSESSSTPWTPHFARRRRTGVAIGSEDANAIQPLTTQNIADPQQSGVQGIRVPSQLIRGRKVLHSLWRDHCASLDELKRIFAAIDEIESVEQEEEDGSAGQTPESEQLRLQHAEERERCIVIGRRLDQGRRRQWQREEAFRAETGVYLGATTQDDASQLTRLTEELTAGHEDLSDASPESPSPALSSRAASNAELHAEIRNQIPDIYAAVVSGVQYSWLHMSVLSSGRRVPRALKRLVPET
ncbi:hypothetical protein LTR95_001199 [Oleoguttula sp. CCFEE 5521]